jgi:hypothetical protein
MTQETPDKLAMQKAFAGETMPSVLVYPSAAGLDDHVETLRTGALMPAPAVKLNIYTPAAKFAELITPIE